MRLAALRLFVRDLASARAFYGGLLGLPLAHAGAGFLAYRSGGVDFIVETVPPDAPADEQALVGRFAGVSFAVDDLGAEHRRLAAAGVIFSGMPEAQPWGGTLATLLDPAGNQIQLVQYPAPARPR